MNNEQRRQSLSLQTSWQRSREAGDDDGLKIPLTCCTLEDDADTDFRCLTAVSCYELSVEKLNLIKEKKEDMRAAYRAVEEEVFKPQFPLALDYIIHNNADREYDYVA